MSCSVLVSTCNAISSLLATNIPCSAFTTNPKNGHPVFVPADAVRRNYGAYILKLDESAAEELRIDVVPQGMTSKLENRGGDLQWRVLCDVIIRLKLTPNERDDADGSIFQSMIDDCVALTESLLTVVHDINYRRLPGYDVAVLVEAKIKTIAPPESLKTHSQFTAILALTYDVRP